MRKKLSARPTQFFTVARCRNDSVTSHYLRPSLSAGVASRFPQFPFQRHSVKAEMSRGRGVLAVVFRESCSQQRRLHEPEKAFVKIVRRFKRAS